MRKIEAIYPRVGALAALEWRLDDDDDDDGAGSNERLSGGGISNSIAAVVVFWQRMGGALGRSVWEEEESYVGSATGVNKG